ncbi:Not1-domain-containing protein, partial [Hortaea werneckii]
TTRGTRPQHGNSASSHGGHTPRRGLTPISANASSSSAGPTARPDSSSQSPSRRTLSPTSSAYGHQTSVAAANRQAVNSQPATSPSHSLTSPPGSVHHPSGSFHSAQRSRAPTATGSPRLTPSFASLSSLSQATAGGASGSSRLNRHQSPSITSPTLTSPTSSSGGASSGQLTSLVVTQLNILLSTTKESNFRTQTEKIRRLLDENGMELFETYFKRLLHNSCSLVFPKETRPGGSSAESHQMLAQELDKIATDPQQAEKVAQALDVAEGSNFNYEAFIEHFQLGPLPKTALLLATRTVAKSDQRRTADSAISAILQPFLTALISPSLPGSQDDLSPAVLATIIERLSQKPPTDWGERQREDFIYAIKMRYQKLGSRIPAAVDSALYLNELLESPDSRLARAVQRAGTQCTASLDACKEMLAGVDTRDISYPQIANALLLMVIAQGGEAYDATTFVQGLRAHKAGSKIDWTDVVQGFDKEPLRVTKKQFLGLYNALLPLARDYANFDIQSLWGGTWQWPATQLSFVVAFLSTAEEELDVAQIPNFRQAFTLADYNDAPDSIKAFAAQAVKHPLVSKDATEALFLMIFRTQEAYNEAQMLGIPETLINPNMTVFICAAAAVPKPWGALQEQALKQLFYPFILKQHPNYDFVMHSLWMQDKTWVAGRMVEFYTQDTMLLTFLYDHAVEHGWLELLLTIQSNFGVDLATYAHGQNRCNLVEWAQPHMAQMGPNNFARALLAFMRPKMDEEMITQKEPGTRPTTVPLSLKTVHGLLMLLAELFGDEELGSVYRQSLQTYPRLFNYGEDEKRDAILEASCMKGHALPDEAGLAMEERYKRMYSGSSNPEDVVNELKELKVSADPAQQDLFAAMLHGLFDEYNCFGEYPNEALATTAVLFGGLVSLNVLSGVAEQAAIYMVFEAVSEYTPDDSMYRFGLQAMIHLQERLEEWPHVAGRILHTENLRNTQPWARAERVLKGLQQDSVGLNGDAVNGIANGVLDEDFPAEVSAPSFSAIHIDPPLRPEIYEDPNEDVSDKIMFVLNNVSKRNLDEKFKDLAGALEDRHHQWFAHYLVEELAKSQPNFQGLYLQLLESFNKKVLWQEVVRETYISCAKMLNAQSTMDSTTERTNLKNLAGWLGALTLARNQPILHRNISFKDLLIEGHATQRLLVAIPFTCKALIQAAHSKVFKPPNPWLMELLGLLSELYVFGELRLNLKFEIEVLCKDLNLDIKSIEPLEIIRMRPTTPEMHSMLQSYVPDGADGFGDAHLMSLSKRAPSERFSPEAVIQALPDLAQVLQIPQAAGNVTQPQLRNIFVSAAQQAIFEIIAPVVERSVTIAAISTAELIQKDFATEPDVEKLRGSAHTVVKALSGSLALVTCKEPLRMSIMNNIRILAARNMSDQLPEGQIIMFVNDNIDTVCSLVENAAEEHSLAEIDAQLDQAVQDRKRHIEQRPNEPFNNPPVSRWATLIPEPFRQDPHPHGINANGLNRQQLQLYEDFGRQARMTPAAHAASMSQDARGQLPDVLSEQYLPNLPTPAEGPVMPRAAPQQRIIQGQGQANGYIDTPEIGRRMLELMQDLQQAIHEAPEEHLHEIGENAPITRLFRELIILLDSTPQRDHLALAAGQHSLMLIYNQPEKRLEVEVFCRLLKHFTLVSQPAGRHLAMYLASYEDDKLFNAPATICLIREGMLDVQHIDIQASKSLRARRIQILPFMKEILDEAIIGESSVALRADFVLTYEALGQWVAEEPNNDELRDLVAKLQLQPNPQNGMPSPPQQDQQDQLEYLFEEWVRMQNKNAPERAQMAFLYQLQEKRVIAEPEESAKFFRACLEVCRTGFERATSMPYGDHDAYVEIDALAALIRYLVIHQSAIDGQPQPNKAKSLQAILSLMVLIIHDHHNKEQSRFYGRLYFRLFSSLLCELWASRSSISAEQEPAVFQAFADALLCLQPRFIGGFAYPWLGLISHRLMIPAFLTGNTRSNGGQTFAKLISAMLTNLGYLVGTPEATNAIQEWYRGAIRFMLMLHHDFPEFLIENHVQLNSSVPSGCAQMHNIINSACSRGIMEQQPDPFTPGLKVNRLDQVRQAPVVESNVDKILSDAGVKDTIERVCTSSDLRDEDATTISNVLTAVSQTASGPLIVNSLIAYMAIHATTTSSVFSSAAAPARLLERLLRSTDHQSRYQLVSAMMNQVRYANAHTHYFSTALQHLFSVSAEDVQEQIMRVLVERLMVPRPHPWGVIVMILEMVKNENTRLWDKGFMKVAPQVQSMLMNLAQSQERVGATRSPFAGGA